MNSLIRKISAVLIVAFGFCCTCCAKSDDVKKLEALFADGKYPFTNANGEAAEISKRILANKEDFLKDLNFVISSDSDDLLVLVDKKHNIGSEFVPSDLVHLTDKTNYNFWKDNLYLRASAEKALAKMASDAKKDGVTNFLVSSTYRSYDYQKNLFDYWVRVDGLEEAERESARAGTSQHQLGTAVDFGSIDDSFDTTAQGQWVYKNAAKYGWSLSFPKGYESVTGYRWECWHFRYVGIPACRFQEKWFKNCQQYMLEFIDAWQNAQ